MRVAVNSEIQQIGDSLVGSMGSDHSFECQAPGHLEDLKIDELRRVQGFLAFLRSLAQFRNRAALASFLDLST